MRTRRLLGVILMVTGAVGTWPPPASAADYAICTSTITDLISPGVSMTPSENTFHQAQPGTIDCHGMVNGRQVTGPGTFEDEGVITGPFGGATCAQGEGTAREVITLPTSGGPVRLVSDDETFRYAAGSGEFRSTLYSGVFNFVPVTGDCLTSPVTAVTVRGVRVIMS